jgi:pectin methylesterase-like acyl-CoA thioesterase
MMMKRLTVVLGALALVTVLTVVSVGAAFAQTDTPPAQTTPTTPTTPDTGKLGRGFGFGFKGGDTASFDAVAAALNLTPTQLFEQLHSGKTLTEIAEAQGVDLATVQAAANASRAQAMKDRIAAAVAAGTITQEQADWMLQGIEKGWSFGGKGFGGRGHGHGRGMGGMMPFGGGAEQAPTTPSLGSSS